MKEIDAFDIKTLDVESLEANNEALNTIVVDLHGKTNWRGTSDNYVNAFNALKELMVHNRKMVEGVIPTLEDTKKYIELAEKSKGLVDKYLSEKKLGFFSSQYAHDRVDTMKNVQSKLDANIKAMKERQMELDVVESKQMQIQEALKRQREDAKARDLEALDQEMKAVDQRVAFHGKYGLNTNKQVFWGDNFTEETIRNLNLSDLKADRTGPYSVAQYAMFLEVDENNNSKYTYEDIMDPSKLQAEKAEMFKKVIELYEKHAKPDTKQEADKVLADIMYRGSKRTTDILNAELKKVDYNNPNFVNTEHFAKIMILGEIAFDISQEVAHVKDAVLELAKKDGFNFKNISEYQKHMEGQRGVVGDLGVTTLDIGLREEGYQRKRIDNPKEARSDVVALAVDDAKFQVFKSVLERYARETNKEKDFSEWYKESGIKDDYMIMSGMVKAEANKYGFSNFDIDKSGEKMAPELHDEIYAGRFCKGVTYGDLGNGQNGFMGFKHYDETYVERKMTEGNDLRIMCANKYNNFKVNKEELEGYELDVINKAQKSLLNITNLALENAKITDENRKSIIKDAKNIMRAEIMLKHKADDYSGKELEIAVEGSLRAANYDEMLKDASISKVAYHALFRGNNNVIENDNNILYQGRNAIKINEKFEAKKESMKAKQIE
ncbi:MAG: hypothetical protein II699_07070, partial [Lachnospiraceae bacterium]|nr:hypothetical protein [Lachnospiraceae bacterium]